MQYVLFLVLAILYNLRKFSKEKGVFLQSLVEAKNLDHRQMILSHHFHVFIFESFLAIIVSHVISERAFAIGLLGLGGIYLVLLAFGLFIYQYFLKYLERSSGIEFRQSFNQHVIKEFRVSFALIMLPILLYSLLNWTFQDEGVESSGNLWFIGFICNIIFVSVLTISCTVIIMLRLIPNREITEPEYVDIIQRRLNQIGMNKMRVQWIETDVKNAFVVGIKLLKFSNQTLFVGRSLRNLLTLEEFDAVIAHELAHIANRHIHKRVIELLKNFLSSILGNIFLLLIIVSAFHLGFGEDIDLHEKAMAASCGIVAVVWFFFNYSLFFDTIRSHEYEADAYAVIELGANFGALKSALEKLTRVEEVPEYLKSKTKKKERPQLFRWVSELFTTHPTLEQRMSSLEDKIQKGLPFNYYVSTAQKIKSQLAWFVQWKVSLPMTGMFAGLLTWGAFSIREGKNLVTFIQNENTEAIIKNQRIANEVNSKPFLVGRSLMYYIVSKQDSKLIDHYIQNGANPGRTLIYLSETKNFPLFQKYYADLGPHLTEDEYFLVLLKSANTNFTEGYRYLVNSPKFDSLSPDFKADIARMHKPSTSAKQRSPASQK